MGVAYHQYVCDNQDGQSGGGGVADTCKDMGLPESDDANIP